MTRAHIAGCSRAALMLAALLLAGCGTDATVSPALTAAPTSPGPASTLEPTDGAPTAAPATGTRPSPMDTSPPAQTAAPTEPAATAGQFDPTRVALRFEQVARGLDPLTSITHAGDGSGRLYVVEQRGLVLAIVAGGQLEARPLLDIRDRVRAGGEQGLLGLALHPDFSANGRLFVNYTDTAGDTVVSEFTAVEGAADPATERVLLTIDQPFGNHNGGMVAFGPDGALYVATGDGGGGGDPLGSGQDRGSLLGALLRLDVAVGEGYEVPPDNPFAGDDEARPEIWAYGLRNPWRFSFDRLTGDLFIGDVGQGAWEEINAEPAGAGGRNYGWNVMEGPECFATPDCDASGLTLPVAAYRRADGNCAVVGGYVYRGSAQPLLAGAYLFADYCSGTVWALDAARAVEGGAAEMIELARSGIRPAAFGEDEAGELYLAGQGGEVLRVVAEER